MKSSTAMGMPTMTRGTQRFTISERALPRFFLNQSGSSSSCQWRIVAADTV